MLYPVDDFRELTRQDVLLIAKKLNEHPRKTLDIKLPKQVFSQLR
jgi:IS30 family transposase